ncbi:MAG: TonB-dependent receptor [Pseudolabrys sp.]|nr:TonB-dependent receptor [Pseudolabrys sp.]
MPRTRLLGCVSLCALAVALPAFAQSAIETPELLVTAQSGSLVTPNVEAARRDIQQTPGAVAVVPDTAFKNTPANTIRDVLGWVPGVITQPKSNVDNRVSIRGSGLTRNYGNRGVNIFMDGIPINTADGLFDVFEIDPSAYRYVEVFKGANALRYGSNSLGGAVNFVTPTGRDANAFEARLDAGSFGYVRSQASTGGAKGPYDWFITGSAQREDGYRDHSQSHMERGSANFGYQFTPDAETRFYVNLNSWRARLPGEVTKDAALNAPRAADSEFVRQDQQRNIDSVRVANKTTLRFDATTVDFGVFGVNRHVDHPIYRYLDYRVNDYGGFVRATDDRIVGGFRNRLVTGVNVHNGTIDYEEFANLTGAVKGALLFSTLDKSQNYSAYAENSFYFLPDVAFVAGGQFQHTIRERQDRFLADGDQSGRRTFDIFSPKVGLLWDVDPTWQVFGNISRSAEVPSFDVNSFASPASTNVEAQTATTYEVGTRGRRPDLTWDISLYRANIRNELQCLTAGPFTPCAVVNADRTVHQGVEAGLGIAFLRSAFADGDRFWLNVAYTYSDFRFDGDPAFGNNRLPGVPPHSVRAEILYKHPSGFYAGPNVDWVPQAFFADNANSLAADPYALLNFRAGLERERGWSGYVEARNLFDTRYISSTIIAGNATPTAALFNPGTGRGVFAGLQFKL